MIKIFSDTDVLTAAKQRIRNVFSGQRKICIAFSAGKDSLVMSHIVWSMIKSGEIDGSKLVVVFIDEEGLYPSMVKNAMLWKSNFESVGVEFRWYCLPFKQVCTIDHLSAEESWITWEPGKEKVWIRDMPPFAIKSHPVLKYAGQMNYQTFMDKAYSNYCTLIGCRTDESIQRLRAIGSIDPTKPHKRFYPIYDWDDSDVWYYIKQNNLYFPEIYIRLYEAGVARRNLRLSAFFGDCTTQGLRWIAETDPALWERIERREPNAYLAMLYWDSEMFRRQTRKRKALENDEQKKDYKELLLDLLFRHPERYYIPKDTAKHLQNWKNFVITSFDMLDQKYCKTAFEAILYGDPKSRVLRALYSTVYREHIQKSSGRKSAHERIYTTEHSAMGGQKFAKGE